MNGMRTEEKKETKKIEEVNLEREKKRQEFEEEEKKKAKELRQQKKLSVPFDYEIGVCNSLIVYLNKLLPADQKKKEEGGEEEKKEEKKSEIEKGYIKGRDQPEDLIFGKPISKKKKKKKRKKKNNNKKAVSDKITHNWDTFTRFEELDLGTPPITKDQVPASIQKVRAKLGEFKKKSQEKKAEILKQIEEEEKKEKEAELKKKKLAEKRKKEEEEKENKEKEKNEKEGGEKKEDEKKEEAPKTNNKDK